MIKAVIFDMYETLITHFRTPLYFGDQMAQDAGIPVGDFRRVWDPTSDDRTLGKMTFEEALKKTLAENGDIIPMLGALGVRNIGIGLISNCFSEEVPIIKDSVLYRFFDAACFSYEEGIKKPDREIYLRCLDRLLVEPHECAYVGDGGSGELEAARDLGMPTYQAVWYLDDRLDQVARRKDGFIQLERPLDLIDLL